MLKRMAPLDFRWTNNNHSRHQISNIQIYLNYFRFLSTIHDEIKPVGRITDCVFHIWTCESNWLVIVNKTFTTTTATAATTTSATATAATTTTTTTTTTSIILDRVIMAPECVSIIFGWITRSSHNCQSGLSNTAELKNRRVITLSGFT